MADGTTFYYVAFDNKNTSYWSIDTNGEKGPNVLGRDAFLGYGGITVTDVSGASKSLPASKITTIFSMIAESTKTTSTNYNYTQAIEIINPSDGEACGTIGSDSIKNVKGLYGCLDRIMEEGWKMNY